MFGRPMLGRRLLRTVASTAVVAGTATVVGGAVRRHQQRKAQTQQEAQAYEQAQLAPQPAYAPPPPAAPANDHLLDQLRQLGQLKADGILTDAEFDTQKARLLNA